MIYIIISIVIFLSCTIGATVGLGGGVIIKPVLDSMNFASVDVVNFISSFAVFAMSISSMIRHKIQNTKFDKKTALLVSFGAVGGGFIGNRLFRLFLDAVGSETVVIFQAVMIILFVGFAVYYVNKKNARTFEVTNPLGIILTGLALG
ncbi:MAG TPA: sulfite exporter TauE/SafE family protein, partial [Ruminococcaceae bacterium]|nr:sulfite exporter TauE/SafE family protein [Oscillospiraceae bacterium]